MAACIFGRQRPNEDGASNTSPTPNADGALPAVKNAIDAVSIAATGSASDGAGPGVSGAGGGSARETRHDDTLLALVQLSAGSDPLPADLASASSDAGTGSSAAAGGGSHEVLAALSRTLAALLALLFKRPIRLFRPVKISTWAGLQAIAEERGKSVSPSFVRALIRTEGWRFVPRHILPPLVVNAAVGFILFFSYAATTATLAPLLAPTFLASAVVVPFVSGAIAGAAQSIVSTPLDNARLLLIRRQRLLALARAPRTTGSGSKAQRARLARATKLTHAFTGWWHLLHDAVFRPSATLAATSASGGGATRLERARAMAGAGYTAIGLVALKDGAAFGSFFLVFSLGRRLARKAGLMWDGLAELRAPDRDEPDEDEARRRTGSGIILQSALILVSGGVAGWIFSLVARPFDRARGAIMDGRERWARETAQREAREAKKKKTVVDAQPSAGRRTGRVRLQKRRKRAVGRTFLRKFRRKEKRKATERAAKRRADKADRAAHPPQVDHATHSSRPVVSKVPPSELQLVRAAAHRYGLRNLLFAANPELGKRDARKAAAPLTKPLAQVDVELGAVRIPGRDAPVLKRARGPTLLSARGHLTGPATVGAAAAAGARWTRRAQRVLAFVPPYAVGFFIYALLNGDLGT